MTTEGELLEELKRCGWNNPTEAVLAHWQDAVRSKFDWSQGVLRWPVYLKPSAYRDLTGPPKATPAVIIEYWREAGSWEGKSAFRILGRVSGICASEIEVQEPMARS
jgi:hypothetical protein